MHMKLQFFYLFITLFICGSAVVPHADSQQTIDDLIATKEYRDFARKTRRAGEIQAGYITQSEYLGLFSKGKAGGKQLLEWLGTGDGQFKRGHIEAKSEQGYLKGQVDFQVLSLPDKQKLTLTVLLPKPSSVSASSWGLFDEFRQLQPPTLIIDSEETISGRFGSGQLYYHKAEGTCSLLIKIARGGLMNIYTTSCAYREQIIELANSLDVRRLNQKLNS